MNDHFDDYPDNCFRNNVMYCISLSELDLEARHFGTKNNVACIIVLCISPFSFFTCEKDLLICLIRFG